MSADPFVAIVGAGPVGLTLAFLLARQGIGVQVFEAAPDIIEDLRASTFHPPTLDLLAPFGIAEALVREGRPCPDWQVRLHPEGERAVFDLSAIAGDTAYPFRLQCEQWRLQRHLVAQIATQSHAAIHWAHRVVRVSADGAGATLEVDDGRSISRVRARYAVGCDGARSVVRAAMGVEFAGAAYPETTILATTLFPFQAHLEGLSNVSYCWKAGGNFSLLRLPELWRVSLYAPEHRPLEESLAPESIAQGLADIVPAAREAEVLEVRPYRVHQRIASHYRSGRMILAGDAAHLNSPAGGMGMNGGIHDAFNLVDKLARIAAGESDALLDLYERQRRPIAEKEIIAQADANRARMREKDPAKRREILAGLQAITRDPARLKAHLLKTSMITGLRESTAIQ